MTMRDRILRVAVLALLLYATACLAREYRLLCRTEQRVEALAARQEMLAEQNRTLTQQLEQPPDRQEMRRLAWERLGMAAPGETIFIFTQEDTDREDTVWEWK